MKPRDTTRAARERQLEALRRMSPEDRLRMAVEMSDETRALAEAGIRDRHPDFSDRDVRDALQDVILGKDLAAAARRTRPADPR